LIRDGATLVADASHILDDLGELPFTPNAKPEDAPEAMPELPEDEAKVLAVLDSSEAGIDPIIQRCGLPAHEVTAILMKLEMRRLVRAFPGFRFARR
ncbi:MAG: DNA-protecting protein DprA, partial [Verrucomicrobiota bacterium]